MTTRNLTDSFIFMRNNSIQNRQYSNDDNNISDRAALLSDQSNRRDLESGINSEIRNEYKSTVSAIQYDFTKIQQKMKTLISLHDKHLNQASLDDNIEEDRDIEIQTRDLTKDFTDVHRRLSQLAASSRVTKQSGGSSASMATNIQSNLARTLQDLSAAFRRAQSHYLTRLKSRDDRLRGFFELPEDAGGFGDEDSDGLVDCYLQDQGGLQRTAVAEAVSANRRAVRAREAEIGAVVRSMEELAGIFREVGSLVAAQGALVDRIDHNVEHCAASVKAGLGEVERAHKYQRRDRKMLVVAGLALLVVVLLVVLVATRLS